MISRKIIYTHVSSRVKTKDLNKISKLHGIMKSYKHQIISRNFIYNNGSSRIKTKDLNKNFK